MTADDFRAMHASGDTAAIERALEAASEEGRRKMLENEKAHADFHGRPLVYVVVERRRGYRGHSVCRDCYYGREWK